MARLKNVFDEDIATRFESMNWNVLFTSDSVEDINNAIIKAKTADKPTLIEVITTIGKGSMLAGSNKVHSGPLGVEEVSKIKTSLGVRDIPFTISNEAVEEFRNYIKERNKNLTVDFDTKLETLESDELSLFKEVDG